MLSVHSVHTRRSVDFSDRENNEEQKLILNNININLHFSHSVKNKNMFYWTQEICFNDEASDGESMKIKIEKNKK